MNFVLLVAALLAPLSSSSANIHLVPLFPSPADPLYQGFVRVVNHSAEAGDVIVEVIDDGGNQFEPVRLTIGAEQTAHFNSDDLAVGNPDKGLTGGVGSSPGEWRLELSSELDIEVLAYIRASGGFLTAMHDLVQRAPGGHRLPIFNPGRNHNQISLLRLINRGGEAAEVKISGIDDAAMPSAGGVILALPPGTAKTLSSEALESDAVPPGTGSNDNPREGLSGSLGAGNGKWQLRIESDQPIEAMNLLASPTGHLTNLSTAPSTIRQPNAGESDQPAVPEPPLPRDPILERLTLPAGFAIDIVSSEVANARQMALDNAGTLFVGTLRSAGGRVYALPNALRGGSPEVVTLATGLTMPSGIAVRGNDLYVAALNRILRFSDIGENLSANAPYAVITDQLPTASHHGWKYIKFGPDGSLYVPVGAPCNVCLSDDDDPRYAALLRMDPSNGESEIIAHGIRNTVGFAWHPESGQLWFSDNGRDYMGDDLPPEEFNVLTSPGQHFGFPFVHATNQLDPRFGNGRTASDYTPPVVEIQAHSAALGIDFYTHSRFPTRYRNALFVAEHGSWNRSRKVGYQVGVIVFDNGAPSYEPFITGWLNQQTQRNWGRPNDVLVAPDGSLLISDDQYGSVYRVTYTGD